MGRACHVNGNLSFWGGVYLFCILCVLMVSGCGESRQSFSNPESNSASFRWSIINPDADGNDASVSKASVWDQCSASTIAYVRGIVYEDQSRLEMVRSEDFPCTAGGGEIFGVKPNTDFLIVLVGLDERGNIIYRGQSQSVHNLLPGGKEIIGDGVIDIYPMGPSGLQVQTNQGQMSVSWSRPDVRASVSYYSLYMDSIKINETPIPNDGTKETITATISPLKAGIEYCFSVSAVDGFGNASSSDAPICSASARRYTKLDAQGQALAADATAWEMVRDEETGLVWEAKKDTDAAADDRSMRKLFGYSETADFINGLNASPIGGSRDWRLPTPQELYALVETELEHRGTSGSLATSGIYFSDIVDPVNHNDLYHTRFWTSVVPPGWPSANLVVYYGKGGSIHGQRCASEQAAVRAVHGPVTAPSPDYLKFVDNGDGTITDTGTQLMWQKASFTGVDNQELTWEEAAREVDELNTQRYATHSDWRMPKIDELVSILDFADSAVPSIDGDWFDNDNSKLKEGANFWSSTRSHRSENAESGHEYVYIASFWVGAVYDSWDKVQPSETNGNFEWWDEKTYYLRAVRDINKVDVAIDQ